MLINVHVEWFEVFGVSDCWVRAFNDENIAMFDGKGCSSDNETSLVSFSRSKTHGWRLTKGDQ